MYIRLVTEEQEADDRATGRFRELWEAYDGEDLPPPVRSLQIKVWALLNEGPRTIEEISRELRCSKPVAYVAVRVLRGRGQNIVNRRDGPGPGKYHLLESPPLKIAERAGILRLASKDGRLRGDEVIIELKCRDLYASEDGQHERAPWSSAGEAER